MTPDSGADADLTASPASLTFATDDWSDAQTVTVSSAYDPDNKDGSAEFVLAATSADTGYQGLEFRVTATEKDGAPHRPPASPGVAGRRYGDAHLGRSGEPGAHRLPDQAALRPAGRPGQ